jgi:hypothetical protein
MIKDVPGPVAPAHRKRARKTAIAGCQQRDTSSHSDRGEITRATWLHMTSAGRLSSPSAPATTPRKLVY